MHWDETKLRRYAVRCKTCFSIMHRIKVTVHKIRSCATNCVAEFENGACLIWMEMQPFFCNFCWLCKHVCFLCKSNQRFYSGYLHSSAGSQWPCGLRRRSAAARLLRSWVRIPPGAWMFVCCECRVLSGTGLCDELITRPEESYRLWCVVVYDLETSRMRRPWPALGRSVTGEKKKLYVHFVGVLKTKFNRQLF